MEYESKKLIVSHDDKILFFPIDFFKEYICSGQRCFICGKPIDDTNSNDEHILPNWLLKKFKLHKNLITLSNGTKFRYSQYTIPCCIECNSFYGANVEKPIQSILSSGYEEVIKYIQNHGVDLIVTWLSLIFFKTHYKDLSLRMTRDRSKDDESMIGEHYDWESIHHIYSVARSIYVGSKIDSSAISSIFILPVETMGTDCFDYCDLYPSKSILIQYNDIVIIANLSDGCGASTFFQEEFKKIQFPISGFQIRELLARLSYIATLVEPKTKFYTQINKENTSGIILGKQPETISCQNFDPEEFGSFFYSLIEEIIDNTTEMDVEKKDLIKQGKWTFLSCPNNKN